MNNNYPPFPQTQNNYAPFPGAPTNQPGHPQPNGSYPPPPNSFPYGHNGATFYGQQPPYAAQSNRGIHWTGWAGLGSLFVMPVAAIVFGAINLQKIKKENYGGKALALINLIVGILEVVTATILTILSVIMMLMVTEKSINENYETLPGNYSSSLPKQENSKPYTPDSTQIPSPSTTPDTGTKPKSGSGATPHLPEGYSMYNYKLDGKSFEQLYSVEYCSAIKKMAEAEDNKDQQALIKVLISLTKIESPEQSVYKAWYDASLAGEKNDKYVESVTQAYSKARFACENLVHR